jgi:hypothetical protein
MKIAGMIIFAVLGLMTLFVYVQEPSIFETYLIPSTMTRF